MTTLPHADDQTTVSGSAAAGTARSCFAAALVLAAMVAAIYGQTLQFPFVSIDDRSYVTENRWVAGGISGEGLRWSFSFEAKDNTYWHPFTWLSHMLDVELFGMQPGFHHAVNVALHLMNSLLLLVFLRKTTGAVWLGGVVAALFAVHPLGVESVAWVAERKNVLSTAFWMLSLLVYVEYARRPRLAFYAGLLVLFTLGLLSKPMIVTLPFVLLLLDVWPLRRIPLFTGAPDPVPPAPCTPPPQSAWDPVKEKIPLFLLAGLAAYLANRSMRLSDAVVSFDAIPLGFRLANMAVSYATYMAKVILPSDLAIFYPYPHDIAVWRIAAAVMALCGLSAVALLNLRRRPYIAVGWFWFLGTLVPVSGIVQVGLWPAWADRWAYLPQVGLFIAAAWGVGEAIGSLRPAAAGAALLAAAIVAGLAFSAHRQTQVWASDAALNQNALEKDSENFVAHSNLGSYLLEAGRAEEAVVHLHEAARISPGHCMPIYILALQHLLQQDPQAAAPHFVKALSLDARSKWDGGRPSPSAGGEERGPATFFDAVVSRNARHGEKEALNGIGTLYMLLGRTEEAIDALRAAVGIDPDFADAHNNLGFAYLKATRYPEAAVHLERALAIEPENQAARANLKELSAAVQAN